MITADLRRRSAAAVLVGLALGVSLAGFRLLPGIFEVWNLRAVDQLYALRSRWNPPPAHSMSQVVHVDLTNSSAAALGTRYSNRAHFARVIENLGRMKVDGQLWDFIFAHPRDPARDRAMARATADAGNVYFGAAFRLTAGRGAAEAGGRGWALKVEGEANHIWGGIDPLLTFDELADAARGIGTISIRFDRDGVLRRIPLLIRVGERYFPSLPLVVACDRLKVAPERIVVRPADAVYLHGANTGSGAVRTLRLPIDGRGNLLVNLKGGWERFAHYNMADVYFASDDRYELELWAEELKGKTVVVSDVSTGAADLGPVPGDPAFPLSGVHAQVLESILAGSFLEEISGAATVLVEGILFVTVLVLAVFAPSVAFAAGMGAVAAGYVGICAGAFVHAGYILNMVRPLLFVLLSTVAVLVFRYVNEERLKLEGLRQRDRIRATFGRYLSNEVVEEILGSPAGLELSGELREITILVSDLRGFTALSGAMDPRVVIEILNRYLEKMVEIVSDHGGTVSELQGDGLLVYFGAPVQRDRATERAVACAVAMQNALGVINCGQREGHLPELAMGIGIETGPVVVGNVGSERRAKYTAVGIPVNTAFRIESVTAGDQILISESTHEKVADIVSVRREKNLELKGLEAPMRVYEVDDIEGEMAVRLTPEGPDPLQPLARSVNARLQVLEAKQVSGAARQAVFRALGRRTLELTLSEGLAVDSSVRIRPEQDGSELPDAYGIVTELRPEKDGADRFSALIRITWLPEETRRFLQGACDHCG